MKVTVDELIEQMEREHAETRDRHIRRSREIVAAAPWPLKPVFWLMFKSVRPMAWIITLGGRR